LIRTSYGLRGLKLEDNHQMLLHCSAMKVVTTSFNFFSCSNILETRLLNCWVYILLNL